MLGVAWTPDDSGLVFASGGHLGLSRLYRVALSPDSAPIGSPEMLPVGEQATALSIARTGRLAYSTQFRDTDLWQLDSTDPAKGPEEPPLGGSRSMKKRRITRPMAPGWRLHPLAPAQRKSGFRTLTARVRGR